jgi:hypothetical protein
VLVQRGVTHSIFFGQAAGKMPQMRFKFQVIGLSFGFNASGASNSNLFGQNAGRGATNASTQISFGQSAGGRATGASYSVCIGYFAGAGIGNGIGNTIMF